MKQSEVEERAKFDFIRYAQCWEDADILLDALDIKENHQCLSIASAGDNTFAMLAKSPAKVIAIDLSKTQIYCVELRKAMYRHLSHTEFLELMGSRPSVRRKTLFQKCLPSLDQETIQFWKIHWDKAERYGVGGAGKFENYFKLFRSYVLPLLLSKAAVQDLFEHKSKEERAEFYDQRWNTWRWKLLVRIFFSEFMVGRLGRDPAFFKYVEGTLSEHIHRRVAYAIKDISPSENAYMQWVFTGQHLKAFPFALREEHYESIRENLDRLDIRHQTIEAFVESGEKIDAFNLSNIFEYMSEEIYEGLYETLLKCANRGARFAYWNMMVPRSLPNRLRDRIKPLSELSSGLYAKDKAFFYSNFVVEEVL